MSGERGRILLRARLRIMRHTGAGIHKGEWRAQDLYARRIAHYAQGYALSRKELIQKRTYRDSDESSE